MDPKIRDYIQANHDRYAPEAIRAQLIAAGHDPAAIDVALAAFASERATPADQRPARAYVWFVFWIVAVGILGLIALLYSVNRNPDKVPDIAIFGAGLFGGYLVLGYLIARWLSRRMVPSRAIGWVGAILLAPIVFFLIAYGACAASVVLFGPV